MAPPNAKPAGANGGNRKLIASNWKPHEKNSLKGFFSLSLPSGLVLHNLMLHERDGARWVSFPAKEYLDPNGEKHCARFVDFIDRETANRFRDAALAALDEAAR